MREYGPARNLPLLFRTPLTSPILHRSSCPNSGSFAKKAALIRVLGIALGSSGTATRAQSPNLAQLLWLFPAWSSRTESLCTPV